MRDELNVGAKAPTSRVVQVHTPPTKNAQFMMRAPAARFYTSESSLRCAERIGEHISTQVYVQGTAVSCRVRWPAGAQRAGGDGIWPAYWYASQAASPRPRRPQHQHRGADAGAPLHLSLWLLNPFAFRYFDVGYTAAHALLCSGNCGTASSD